MAFIFHFIYGLSSFPLTNSYFSRWLLHHQPVYSIPYFSPILGEFPYSYHLFLSPELMEKMMNWPPLFISHMMSHGLLGMRKLHGARGISLAMTQRRGHFVSFWAAFFETKFAWGDP